VPELTCRPTFRQGC